MAVAAVAGGSPSGRVAAYKDLEREFVRGYWNYPSRYKVIVPPSSEKLGIYQVRLTADGSLYLWKLNNALGRGKTAATLKPMPSWSEIKTWDAFIDASLEHDRWQAAKDAAFKNLKDFAVAEPAKPGSTPSGLKELLGSAPCFAEAVKPMQHVIDFGDGNVISLCDNPNMRPNFPYYRNAQGVMSGGLAVKSMPKEELDELFEAADVSAKARKVMKAVSLLEGGFDSVNTYDTGFVSVGFIQFACLSTGSGSLGAVLLKEKTNNSEDFHRDFRRFGIDVTPEGLLVALDLNTGFELQGPVAAAKIIEDKRLIAVFQRAGRTSKAFRVAQLQVAHEQYYPAEDAVVVSNGSDTLTGTIGDVIKSEAGMATLMDRKVNTGRTDPLARVIAQYASSTGASSLAQLASYEYSIVQAVKYRKDYTRDDSLSQPAQTSSPASRDSGSKLSRKGTRKGRSK